MTTLRVGIASYEKMKERTRAIARGELKPSPRDPKVWFPSTESMARILSSKNQDLLDVIRRTSPQSLTELAEATRLADQACADFGLDALRDQIAGRLPAGQQRLVEVARAAIGKHCCVSTNPHPASALRR